MKKHLLRLGLFIIIYQASITNAKAQWVSIPDANFGTWLNFYGYSQCLQGNSMVGWQLDTTCNTVINTTGLYCVQQGIQDLTGIEYFDNLDTLRCNGNQLSTLPVLPIGLKKLDFGSNYFTTLPTLPNGLKYLECFDNYLTTLSNLPTGLISLSCGNNPLITLPTLPDSLTYLECYNTQLIVMPSLPHGLIELECGHNHLGTLDTLPVSLKQFYCSGNQITYLPVLPASLSFFDCSNNLLTALPDLPNDLTSLSCNDNLLTTLPVLPDYLSVLHCENNPNLTCLPQLKKVVYFYFTNTAITCLPNYPQLNNTSIPMLSSVALCDVFNQNNCLFYYNISGKVYIDNNASCDYDIGDNVFTGAKVQIYQNSILLQQEYSTNFGMYTFDTDLGDYSFTVDTSLLPFYLACPDTGYHTSNITVTDSVDTDKDFGFRCKPGFDLVAHSISSGFFTPTHPTEVNIGAGDLSNFYGVHCAIGIIGSVQLVMSGPVHFISPAIGASAPSNVSGDTVTWNITDFGAVNFFTDFNIMLQADSNAQGHTLVCFSLVVNPFSGDNNITNNALDYCTEVRTSWDPNEKEVYPAGNIDTAQKWLTYTIHFQNTGTAEAQHIYVTDTLNSNVDPASFQLLAYSHQPMVQIKENAVRFNFPNINLPDSNTNEAASHGYVQYKVKLKDNLPVGTPIFNTAFIYFDFNAPVVTNTTSNTIALSTGLRAVSQEPLAFRVYPNPANESVTISVDENMIGSKLSITDITGRRILISNIEHRISNVEVRELASGVYFVTLENERERVTKKLVIER